MNKSAILALCAASALASARAGQIDAAANLDRQFQTIESFTAADAWSGNFIGKFFADDKKESLRSGSSRKNTARTEAPRESG